VLTRDIILASRLLEVGVQVINDRGYQFNQNEIKARLSEREQMLKARQAGLHLGKDWAAYGKNELAKFAHRLNCIIPQNSTCENCGSVV
jgi:uncharacterized protein YaiI (UPF0178 family)